MQPARPLCELQFEDLSILERRPSSDVQSATGTLLCCHVCDILYVMSFTVDQSQVISGQWFDTVGWATGTASNL